MELKGKHLYGLGAVLVGFAALAFGLVYWFINQKLDTTAQVSFAIGLMGLALFGWLEIDLLTRALNTRQARYGAETGVMILAFLGESIYSQSYPPAVFRFPEHTSLMWRAFV